MRKANLLTIGKMTFIFSVLFLFVNCSKERIEPVPEPEPEKVLNQYSSINSYMDSKKQEEQEFIIDTTGTDPITGNQGTKIWTGKQCLMFPNGDSVSWPYTLKLVELYKPKDMIYYQMSTISGGEILKTEGEIRLRAFKDGQELVLKPDPCMHAIEMPSAAPQANMHVFNNPNPYLDWIENNPVNLFTATATSHNASINTLGWINCGLKAGSSTNSTLTFTSATDNLDNVGIFIYFPATKSVMQVSSVSKVSQSIPNGSDVKIILIGVDGNGNLFSFSKNQTVSANSTIDVVMTAITDAALTALLDAL